jgi:CBS domain-containing protein
MRYFYEGDTFMKIAKVMTKQVHTVGPDQTLKECAELLKKLHVNGLVVVNDGQVAGVITKADIFEAILPDYSDVIENESNIASFEQIEKAGSPQAA